MVSRLIERQQIIDKLQDIVSFKKGTLLSEYKNARSKLTIRCKKGHIWYPRWVEIKNDHWCNICSAQNRKLSQKHVEAFINGKNGKLLNTYINASHYLKVQCDKDHIWNVKWGAIQQGGWCPYCVGLAVSQDYVLKFIKEKGGVLLNLYVNSKAKLKVKCEKGHIWNPAWDSLKSGNWCSICAGKHISEEFAKQFIENKGGILLNHYRKKYLNIKCKKDHIFNMTWNSIRAGIWCSTCSPRFKSEEICRQYFEQIFNVKFPKYRADWLRNDDGVMLELDGYSQELGIAFEHNGLQHYKEIEYFNSSTLKRRKQNDLNKIKKCNNRGVKLIIIPQLFQIIKLKQLRIYLKKQFIFNKIKVPENYDNIKISLQF